MKLAPLRKRRNREQQKEVKIVRKTFLDESDKKEGKVLKVKTYFEKKIVETGGVWLTSQDVKKNVAKLKTKGKQTQALKDQLQYHQFHQRSQASHPMHATLGANIVNVSGSQEC